MAEIPARELRNDTAGVLRRVAEGEDVTITVHGTPVARLVPVEPARHWYARDEAADLIRNHAADPGLRDELRRLSGDTIDDLRTL